MKKLLTKSLVGALVAGSAFVAAPAQAQPVHPCWFPPWTAEELWLCMCSEVATALSPVIPPDQWECGFPDLPPEGGGGS